MTIMAFLVCISVLLFPPYLITSALSTENWSSRIDLFRIVNTHFPAGAHTRRSQRTGYSMCILVLRTAPSVRRDFDTKSTCPKTHCLESGALCVCKGGKNKLFKIQEDIPGKQRLDEDSPTSSGNKSDSKGPRQHPEGGRQGCLALGSH